MVSVAIVSDTHAYLDRKIISVVETCDIAVHAGDIGNKEVLDLLHGATGHVLAVCGNNDAEYLWATAEANVVKALPRVAELALPGGTLAVEHGHVHGMSKPDHDKLRRAHKTARVVVYGHTHLQVIDRSEDPWVINPGAAGATRNHGGPSCLVLHASQQAWEIEAFRF
jgi:putative phosphoesterase